MLLWSIEVIEVMVLIHPSVLFVSLLAYVLASLLLLLMLLRLWVSLIPLCYCCLLRLCKVVPLGYVFQVVCLSNFDVLGYDLLRS